MIKTVSMTSLDYKNLKLEETMDRLGILNIYKLNIHRTVKLMFIVKNNTIPEAFRTKFQIVKHNYATRHSENNFEEPKITFNAKKFAISSRRPRLWNEYTESFVKTITAARLLKAKLKEYLHKTEIKTEESEFLGALLAPLAALLVQSVISSVVKGITGRGLRRAGIGYMNKNV